MLDREGERGWRLLGGARTHQRLGLGNGDGNPLLRLEWSSAAFRLAHVAEDDRRREHRATDGDACARDIGGFEGIARSRVSADGSMRSVGARAHSGDDDGGDDDDDDAPAMNEKSLGDLALSSSAFLRIHSTGMGRLREP